MPISFELIPVGLEVPGSYIEFDNTKATTGLPVIPHVILVVGQKLAAGTGAASIAHRVTSLDQAIDLFGRGSLLHHMFEALKDNNTFTESWGIALADVGAGVQATGTILFGGAPTKAGTLNLYIGGRRVRVGVAATDTAANVATNTVAAITAELDLPVTAVVNVTPEQVDITARHKGETGNDIDVRFNFFDGEALPLGLTALITAMAGGTSNPDIAEVFTAIGDEQYRTIINPWTDAANLTALHAELDVRFGPLKMIEGTGIMGAAGTVGTLGTLGDSQNSQHLVIMGADASPTPPWEWAAALGGQVAFHGTNDPARPFQTLALNGILPPPIDKRFTFDERNILLGGDSISTFIVDAGGIVRIERVVTTYQTNALAIPDKSYHDLNTLLTLFFLRFSLRARIGLKFPRHKLANNGTQFGLGQAIVTPRIIRGEIIALFRDWEAAGLVEGIDQFKTDLIVERNATDPNRVDALIPPDVVNQLRVFAGKVQFRL